MEKVGKAEKTFAQTERMLSKLEKLERGELPPKRRGAKRSKTYRFNRDLYEEFKQLVKRRDEKLTDVLEDYMDACVKSKRILKFVPEANPAEKLTLELQLKEHLSDLRCNIKYDREKAMKKIVDEYTYNDDLRNSASWILQDIYKLLPKITDEKLLAQAEQVVLETVKFYNEELSELKDARRKEEGIEEDEDST
jgi:hypothetical protein